MNYQKEKETNKLLHISNELTAKNYQELHESQMTIRKQVHDFNHHVNVLQTLCNAGNTEELRRYLETIVKDNIQGKAVCKCGNEIIDAIINRKAGEAINQSIRFEYNIDLLGPINIDPVDICALLANQIDNAFDAVSEIKNASSRIIRVKIWRQKGNFVFFQVSNTVKENPFLNNPELVSTKNSKTYLNGLGLKSIKSVAEKYLGRMENTYNDGFFISTVYLSYLDT